MSVPYAFHSNTADSLVGGANLKDELANLSLKINSIDESLNSLRIGALSAQNYLNQLENQTPLTDIDGNLYQKVVIGSQIWMKENLKVSRYRNGDLIPIKTDESNWYSLSTHARTWYNNDSTTYEYPYGNLYNWYAISDNRGICPLGWHVPNNNEWKILTTFLGGESIAAGKMKSTEIIYWNRPNTNLNNESGFSALPGGYRDNYAMFNGIGNTAIFWSAPEYAIGDGWARGVDINNIDLSRVFNPNSKLMGASVRCLRD
jgi:uncharacterized protein (TIGR02145 family)